MIRRFETYAFLPGTAPEARRALAVVLSEAGRHIPEVRWSAVGWNRSDAPAELVWEHAFESAEAYRRYMVHPYHADLIDRYVLPDSPERVVEPLRGAGLFGYHGSGPDFVLEGGCRRVVLLRLEDAAPTRAAAELAARAASAADGAGALLSVVGANTMAAAWFDGETPLPGPPPRWTHILEQGFSTMEALEAFTAASGRSVLEGPPVRRWTELCYEVEPLAP